MKQHLEWGIFNMIGVQHDISEVTGMDAEHFLAASSRFTAEPEHSWLNGVWLCLCIRPDWRHEH